MCPLPQTHKLIAQIKPIAVQQVNWQATNISQVYICLCVFLIEQMYVTGPRHLLLCGLPFLTLNSVPSTEKTDVAERFIYKWYITQDLISVILPPLLCPYLIIYLSHSLCFVLWVFFVLFCFIVVFVCLFVLFWLILTQEYISIDF